MAGDRLLESASRARCLHVKSSYGLDVFGDGCLRALLQNCCGEHPPFRVRREVPAIRIYRPTRSRIRGDIDHGCHLPLVTGVEAAGAVISCHP